MPRRWAADVHTCAGVDLLDHIASMQSYECFQWVCYMFSIVYVSAVSDNILELRYVDIHAKQN